MNIKKRKITKNGKISFCLCTYDGASDLWEPYFNLTQKYWPEFFSCFNKYISLCETKEIQFKQFVIKPVIATENYSFSQRLIKAINELNDEFVFISIDDYWLKSKVDQSRLKQCFEFIKSNPKIDCIEFENFRKAVRNENYSVNYLKRLKRTKGILCPLQNGIWRSSSLLKLLRQNESAWLIEYYGTFRARVLNYNVLTLQNGSAPIFDYDFGWVVQRGKFHKEHFDYFVINEGVSQKIGEKRGYFCASKDTKKKTIWFYFKNAFLCVLSLFRL